MTVIAHVILRGVTPDQYDAVRAKAGWLEQAPDGGIWSPRTLVDRFPLCRIYIRNVNGSLKTHRAQFPQAALFPDAVVIPLDVLEYRGPGLFSVQP